MSNITATGLLVGVFAILFWTPYMFSKGVLSINNDVDMGIKVKCMIPLFNVIYAERYYWGKLWLVSYGTILFVVSTIAKLCTWFFMNSNATLNLVTTILFIITFALFLIFNMVDVYMIIHETNTTTQGKAIILAILYPLGQYFIGAYTATILRKMENKENTFQT